MPLRSSIATHWCGLTLPEPVDLRLLYGRYVTFQLAEVAVPRSRSGESGAGGEAVDRQVLLGLPQPLGKTADITHDNEVVDTGGAGA